VWPHLIRWKYLLCEGFSQASFSLRTSNKPQAVKGGAVEGRGYALGSNAYLLEAVETIPRRGQSRQQLTEKGGIRLLKRILRSVSRTS